MEQILVEAKFTSPTVHTRACTLSQGKKPFLCYSLRLVGFEKYFLYFLLIKHIQKNIQVISTYLTSYYKMNKLCNNEPKLQNKTHLPSVHSQLLFSPFSPEVTTILTSNVTDKFCLVFEHKYI